MSKPPSPKRSKIITPYLKQSPNTSSDEECDNLPPTKEFFRTCNVLPFSCTHLALRRPTRQGKRPKVHAKQKGFKNFFSSNSVKKSQNCLKKAISWT